MFEEFRFRLSPFQNDQARRRLARAVLEGDRAMFRALVGEFAPDVPAQPRLYGALTLDERGGILPVMVDQNGDALPEGYVIPAGTPIDLLNADFTESEIIVTIGDRTYRAPLDAPSEG